jgi:hypothetical protein
VATTVHPIGVNRAVARSAPPRQRSTGTRISSGSADAASSGRSLESPRSADRNTFARAAASRLDAAYGRSLTYRPRAKLSGPGERPLRPDGFAGSTSNSSAAVHFSSDASG